MPKISELKIDQLKVILREKGLSTSGSRAELELRLIQKIGGDEIEAPTVIDSGLQEQINDLRGMMETIIGMLQQNNQRTIDANVGQPNVDNQNANENVCQVSTPSILTNAYVGGFRSIREISDMIPEFDPTNTQSLTVQQFIDRVSSVMRAYQLDEKYVLVAVYGQLKGVARMWLDTLPTVHTSWDDFAAELRNEFCMSYDEAQIHRMMNESGRRTGERISDYCFRVNALGKRFQLSEPAIIQYTRQGLNHSELQSAIAAQRFESTKQMREIIEEWLRNRVKVTTFKQNFGTNAKDVPRQQAANSESKKIVCFNCGEIGHISSKCMKEQKRSRCADCGKVHKRNEPINCGCKQVGHNARKADLTRDEKCFVKKVNVNGKIFEALIDTGSEWSLVRKSTVDMLRIEPEECCAHLNGISGGRYMMRERCMLDIVIGEANDEAPNDEQLTDLRETAAKRINEKRAAAKSRFDAAHATPHTFQEGDLVLAENEPPSTGMSRKLEPRFKGPFLVTKVLDHDRYVVEDLPQTRRTRKYYSSVYSIDKLKRWCQLPEDDENEKDIVDNELSEVAQVYQERPTVNEC